MVVRLPLCVGTLNPRKFLGLCMMAVNEGDAELKAFCSGLTNALLRLTFDHVYAKL